MNRWSIALVIVIGLILMGCSTDGMAGDKPPKVWIEIGNERYETTLGSYCWNGLLDSTCVDTAGPIELLEGKESIKVKPGEEILFVMDYEPKPNEMNVVQIQNNKESDIAVKGNRIIAPMQKGIYYYAYGVWWMDEKEANVSRGDASYAFVLEVN